MKQNAGTFWEDERPWLEYHPKGRNFANENNSSPPRRRRKR